MPMRRVAAAVLGLVLAGDIAQARTLDQVPAYLKKEGPFVSLPAIGGAALGMGVGAVVALPAAVVAAPVGWAAGDPLGYTLVPVSLLGAGGAEVGYHLFGAIPYGLKNAFYDAPLYAVRRIKGDPQSGLVAQVEPPPPVDVNPQYLESTPPDARVPVEITQVYSKALPPPREPTSMMLRRKLSPFKAPPMPGSRAAAGGPPVPVDGVRPTAPASTPTQPVPPVARAEPARAPSPPVEKPVPPPVAAPVVAPPPMVERPAPAGGVVPDRPVRAVEPPPPPVEQARRAAPVEKPVRPQPEQPEAASVAPREEPDASPASQEDDSRPTIKKKKRSFSERFRF